MRYEVGKAATDEMTAKLQRAEVAREAMHRAEPAEREMVSARVQRRRHRLARLFGPLSA